MELYNNTIVLKIADYVDSIVSALGHKDAQERSVVMTRYEVAEIDNIDLSTLQSEGLTASINVTFYFDIFDKDGKKLMSSKDDLAIPRLMNNMFIIEGKPRISTQTLDNSFECRINDDFIQINYNLSILFEDSNRPDEFYIKTVNENWDPVIINKKELDQAVIDNDVQLLNFVKLSDTEKLKLKIKLDTDDIPDYLNSKLILDLKALGSDKFSDSIIDKQISTTESELMKTLYRWQNRKKILGNIARKFWTYGDIYLKDIQNSINRYFKVADDPTISIPDIINPMVYDSLRYKILMPKYLAYNESFSDLIDPVNTPENQNVNRINELNVCCSVEDGVIYIYCYDLSGNKIKVSYLEYLNRPVILNVDYDYDNKKILKRDYYTVKLRLREVKVTDLKSLKDPLVEPKADEKLSITTRRIPMINMSDSVRVAMGAAMSKQAVEVENSEPALIVTGNDEDDFKTANQLIRYQGSGATVVGIKGNNIFIKEHDSGSLNVFNVNQPTVGQNESVVTYVPNVKIGQELKDGDVVISAKIMSRGTYELGVNARCVYLNYIGMSHEDGIIISESFSEKLTSYSIVNVQLRVKSNANIVKILPLGSRVAFGDILVEGNVPVNASNSLKLAYLDPTTILGRVGATTSSINLITPNNIEEGYIVAVKIQKNEDKKTVNPGTEQIIEEYLEKKETSLDWGKVPEQYKKLDIADSEFHDNDSYIISMKLIKVRRAMPGTKLANRYGSKGEISLVIPDHLMPRQDLDGEGNGPIYDIILNPAAVVSRKNPSQLYEALLTKCIHKVYETIQILISNGDIEAAQDFTIKLYGNKFADLSQDEFKSKVESGIHEFRIAVGSYAKYSYEQVMEIAKHYQIKETNYIYCPDIAIGETKDGKKCFDPDQLNLENNDAKDITVHELGFIESPVIDGYTYFMKLFHSSDYTGKVTPSVIDSSQPYMGRGLYRSEGQVMSEMELWSLLSRGTEHFIPNNSSNKMTSQYEFLQELLLAGFTLVDDDELPLLSEYRTKINKLRLSDVAKKNKHK